MGNESESSDSDIVLYNVVDENAAFSDVGNESENNDTTDTDSDVIRYGVVDENAAIELSNDDDDSVSTSRGNGTERSFQRVTKRKYSSLEKEELGKLCVEKKRKYDELVKPGPKDGYLACAVREYYSDMATVRNSYPRLTRAVKLALRCYKDTVKSVMIWKMTSRKRSFGNLAVAGRPELQMSVTRSLNGLSTSERP